MDRDYRMVRCEFMVCEGEIGMFCSNCRTIFPLFDGEIRIAKSLINCMSYRKRGFQKAEEIYQKAAAQFAEIADHENRSFLLEEIGKHACDEMLEECAKYLPELEIYDHSKSDFYRDIPKTHPCLTYSNAVKKPAALFGEHLRGDLHEIVDCSLMLLERYSNSEKISWIDEEETRDTRSMLENLESERIPKQKEKEYLLQAINRNPVENGFYYIAMMRYPQERARIKEIMSALSIMPEEFLAEYLQNYEEIESDRVLSRPTEQEKISMVYDLLAENLGLEKEEIPQSIFSKKPSENNESADRDWMSRVSSYEEQHACFGCRN
jgi:hypothetical protein